MSSTESPANVAESRWTAGSYVAAGFALFLFIYQLGGAIFSSTRPTDGWLVSGQLNTSSPQVTFETNFLGEPFQIQSGDSLLAINDVPIRQLLDAQHTFFRMTPPDWPDGTRLKYEITRDGQPLTIFVPIQTISYWKYFNIIFYEHSIQTVVQLVSSMFFFVLSLVVFLLRPGSRAAHALLFIGVTFFFQIVPGNFSPPTFFFPETPASIPFDSWTLAINPSLMYLVLAFPHPKSVLRRYPRLTVALLYLTWPLAFNTAYLFHLEDRLGYVQTAFTIYPIQIVIMMGITVISLVHSAITVRDPVGRSQLKWTLAGIGSFVFIGVGGWLVSAYLFPNTLSGGNWLFTIIGWFLLPTSLAIAITRYRLFDIDVIIRRTLVYGALTGALALVYFGSVLLLQGLLSRLTGVDNSPLAIVVSTLLVAAMVTPLRRRIQNDIDRRFYRQKYNAEQALAGFAEAARSETEIEALTGRLVGVVQETVQPERVSLWLRQAASERTSMQERTP